MCNTWTEIIIPFLFIHIHKSHSQSPKNIRYCTLSKITRNLKSYAMLQNRQDSQIYEISQIFNFLDAITTPITGNTACKTAQMVCCQMSFNRCIMSPESQIYCHLWYHSFSVAYYSVLCPILPYCYILSPLQKKPPKYRKFKIIFEHEDLFPHSLISGSRAKFIISSVRTWLF